MVSSRSGTRTDVAPARSLSGGYASNDRHAYITSAPGSLTASISCLRTPTDPHPTAMCSAGTENRRASDAVSASAPLSG